MNPLNTSLMNILRNRSKTISLALPHLKQLTIVSIISVFIGLLSAEYLSYLKVRSIVNALNYSVNNQISNYEFSSLLSLRGLVALERDNIKSTSLYKIEKKGTITYRSGFRLSKELTKGLTQHTGTYMRPMPIPGRFIHYNIFQENKLVSIIVMEDPSFWTIAVVVFFLIWIIGILSLAIFNENTTKMATRILRQFTHELKEDRTLRKMLSSLPALIDPRLTSLAQPVAENFGNIIDDLIEKYGKYSDIETNFDHEDIHVLDIAVYPVIGNAIKNSVRHGNDETIKIETKLDSKYLYFSVENGLFKPLSKSKIRSMIRGTLKEKDGMAIIHDNLRRIDGKFDLNACDSTIKIQLRIPRTKIESSIPSSLPAKKMGIKSVAVLDDVNDERTRVWSQIHRSLKISASRYSHLDKLVGDLRSGRRFDLIICDQQGHYSNSLRSWDVVTEEFDYLVKKELNLQGTTLILHSKGAFKPSRKNLFDHYVQKDPRNDWSKILPPLRQSK